VANLVPARLLRNEEGILVRVLELLGDRTGRHALRLKVLSELLTLLVEEVREPLQEEHAENELLVLRGVHVSTQVVACAEEQA
jgi:hypothetical protein